MTTLTWDQVGERLYETGVDHGVLYLPDVGRLRGRARLERSHDRHRVALGCGVLPAVRRQHQVPEPRRRRDLRRTIEAFTYPDEFAQCDGTSFPQARVAIGQQGRDESSVWPPHPVGNDIDGTDHGYKLHLVYGAQAAPSEKAYGTINDSPEAIAFSWEISTTPVP
jgi:hypothetical protein